MAAELVMRKSLQGLLDRKPQGGDNYSRSTDGDEGKTAQGQEALQCLQCTRTGHRLGRHGYTCCPYKPFQIKPSLLSVAMPEWFSSGAGLLRLCLFAFGNLRSDIQLNFTFVDFRL